MHTYGPPRCVTLYVSRVVGPNGSGHTTRMAGAAEGAAVTRNERVAAAGPDRTVGRPRGAERKSRWRLPGNNNAADRSRPPRPLQ